MVAPEFRGAGLGTALQARLQEYAMSRGVRGFVSEILPRNGSMLRLAALAQATVTTKRDDDVVHLAVLFPDSVSTNMQGGRNFSNDKAAKSPPVTRAHTRTRSFPLLAATKPLNTSFTWSHDFSLFKLSSQRLMLG